MSLHSSGGMEETGRIQRIRRNRGGAGLISPETGQTWWATEATTGRSCAKLENNCHNVTGCQGGSGSKGTNRKGKSLSDLLPLLPTPCHHCFDLFACQVTSPKFLAAHQSSTGFPSCRGKSLSCCLPCCWAQPAKRSSLRRLGGAHRSAAELPHPAVPSSSWAGSHHSYCKNCPSENPSAEQQIGIFCIRLCAATHKPSPLTRSSRKWGSQSSLELYLCGGFGFFLEPKPWSQCPPICSETGIALWVLTLRFQCPPSLLEFFVFPLHREGRSFAGIWWSKGIIQNMCDIGVGSCVIERETFGTPK